MVAFLRSMCLLVQERYRAGSITCWKSTAEFSLSSQPLV